MSFKFGRPTILWSPDPDPSGGSGGEGGQDEKGAKPEDSKPADADGKSGDGSGDDKSPNYVTPTQLQGLMDYQRRQTAAELEKTQKEVKGLTSKLDSVLKKLEEKSTPPKDGKDDKSKESDKTELVELRRAVSELQEKLRSAEDRANEAEQKRLDTDFETTVIQALIDAECEKPKEALLVIRPHLNQDPEDPKRIYANVKSEFGPEEVPLETFISREFKENILPHVFKGKMRTGAPASGDGDGGSGGGSMRIEDLSIEDYASDPDKYRKMIEAGKVKGAKNVGSPK